MTTSPETIKPQVSLEKESSLSFPEGMRPGFIGSRALNLVRLFTRKRIGEPASLTSFRAFCQDQADWQVELSSFRSIGPIILQEIESALGYFDWVDQNVPDGIPPETFVFWPQNEELAFNLAIVEEDPSINAALVPIFEYDLRKYLIAQFSWKRVLPAIPLSWQEEIDFLAKYYGLIIQLKSQEETALFEVAAAETAAAEEVISPEIQARENLERLIAIGQENLPLGPLESLKLLIFLKKLHYFDRFPTASLHSLENFLCLGAGIGQELADRQIAATQSERDFRIFLDYFFQPGANYQQLARDYGFSGRGTIGVILQKFLRKINSVLGRSPLLPSDLLLPKEWPQAEELSVSPEEATIQFAAKKIDLLQALQSQYGRSRLNLVVEQTESGRKLNFNLPEYPPQPKSLRSFTKHGYLPLRPLVETTIGRPYRGPGKNLQTIADVLKENEIKIFIVPKGNKEKTVYYFIHPSEDKEQIRKLIIEADLF